MIYHTKYGISTITNNIDITVDDIKTKINLDLLFDYIHIVENDFVGFIWTQCERNNERLIRGKYPKKKEILVIVKEFSIIKLHSFLEWMIIISLMLKFFKMVIFR